MERFSLTASALTASALLVAGCANVTGTAFEDGRPANGVFVNGAATIAVADATGVKVLNIADPCYKYALNFNALLAKNTTNVELYENGTLKTLGIELDSTDVLKELPDIIKAVNKDAKPETRTLTSEARLYSFKCVNGEIKFEESDSGMIKTQRSLAPSTSPANTDNKDSVSNNSGTGFKNEEEDG